MPEAELHRSDFHTPTWAKLRQHYEARLATLRRKNDSDLEPRETAHIRGQIAECKYFLALEAAPETRARPPGLNLAM